MKVALLIAPRDFKDETVSRLKLLSGKMDIELKIAGMSLKPCTGYHGAVVKPEVEARELEPSVYDALLIGDGPGVESQKLFEHRPLLDLVKAFHDSNKIIGGIGNGIKVISKSNSIKDAKIARTEGDTEKMVKLYRGIPT